MDASGVKLQPSSQHNYHHRNLYNNQLNSRVCSPLNNRRMYQVNNQQINQHNSQHLYQQNKGADVLEEMVV